MEMKISIDKVISIHHNISKEESMKFKALSLCILILSCLLLSGCLAKDGTYTQENPAGFWWGFWHGLISPVALIISFFKSHLSIYEPINTGIAYNIGFLLGISCVFSGGHKTITSNKK